METLIFLLNTYLIIMGVIGIIVILFTIWLCKRHAKKVKDMRVRIMKRRQLNGKATNHEINLDDCQPNFRPPKPPKPQS